MLAKYVVTKPEPVTPPPPTITLTLTLSVEEVESLRRLSHDFFTNLLHGTARECKGIRTLQAQLFNVLNYALTDAKTP